MTDLNMIRLADVTTTHGFEYRACSTAGHTLTVEIFQGSLKTMSIDAGDGPTFEAARTAYPHLAVQISEIEVVCAADFGE